MTLTRSILMLAIAAATCVSPARGQQYEFSGGKWIATSQAAAGTSGSDLEAIREYVENHQAGAAIGAVKKFVKKYPGDPNLEEAQMLAGEAELNREHYWQAYEWFEKQLDAYPAGRYSDRTLRREYTIGEAFLNGKKRIVWGILYLPAESEGVEILNRVVEHAPGSALGERAMIRVADYHFNHRDWAQAAQDYDHFVTLFRNSARVPYATLQAARAAYLDYRGPNFDETPLLDAEQRFKIFREHYPADAAKANVNQTLKDIHELRAQKQYSTVEFYKRTGHPIPEAYYDVLVADQFPDTPYAAKADRDRMTLGDLKTPAPAAQPQTRPFTPPPAEPAATEPTTTQAATAPASRPATTATSGPALRTATGPVRLEELIPTTQGGFTVVPKPGPATSPARASAPSAATQPAINVPITPPLSAGGGKAAAPPPATQPASQPAAGPVRLNDLAPTTEGASQPATTPTDGGKP